MFAYSRLLTSCTRSTLLNGSRSYIRPISSSVFNSNILMTQNNSSSTTSLVPQNRNLNMVPVNRAFQTSAVTRDIDSAAKFIGAGAATVGVAGSVSVQLNDLHVESNEESPSQVTVIIRKSLFERYGDVHYYAVLVSSRGAMESPRTGKWNGENWPNLRKWEDAKSGNRTVVTYQTTPVKWKPSVNASHPGTFTFTIGTGECDSFNYCNKPLKKSWDYALKVRAFTRNEFQDTDVVYFKTSESLPVGFISLVLGGIFVIGAVSAILSVIPVDVLCSRRFSVRYVTSPSTILFKSYSPSKFRRHANDLLKTTGRLNNEFHLLGTLSANLTTPCLHAQRIDNREKNRYGDVIPFDVTRVELSVVDGDPSTDYINASYIKGYHQQIEYIAAQGPKRETCRDFYRMIMEQKVEVIVMLTDLEDNGSELCYKYFPEVGSTLKFGDIEVCCKFEKDKDFCVRRKLVVRSNQGEFEVVHLHFEGWPDFNCPEDSEDVVKLCEYTRQIPHTGYRLVHGTAGTGRSGTFIALDILLQSIRNHDKISVFKTVLELRQQRVNMVQTLDQYAFIYKCISGAVSNISGKCKITEL